MLCAIPVIGWIACAVALILAGLIALIGTIIALNDTGHPSDVNAELTELHTNDATGRGADLLVIKGTWVYDSLHDGWNEIHPILQAQRIGTWSGSWGVDAAGWRNGWCRALATAADPLTVEQQGRDENQWVVHPSVDGCKPEEQEPARSVIR